jgi:hypothetical protein
MLRHSLRFIRAHGSDNAETVHVRTGPTFSGLPTGRSVDFRDSYSAI